MATTGLLVALWLVATVAGAAGLVLETCWEASPCEGDQVDAAECATAACERA